MENTTKDNGACQHETLVSGSKLRITDLRIGNFVTWIDDEEEPEAYRHLIVNGLFSNETIHIQSKWEHGDGEEMYCGLEYIKPIPITHKWLEWMGFEKIGKYYYLLDCYIKIEPLKDGRCAFRYGINTSYSVVIGFARYVHQIQNVLFSLTGEELKLDR